MAYPEDERLHEVTILGDDHALLRQGEPIDLTVLGRIPCGQVKGM